MFENAGFDLTIELIHNQYETDTNIFTKKRSTDIFDQSKAISACHLDLIAEFTDKTDGKVLPTTLKTGSASISRVEDVDADDEDLYKDFRVEGNFSGIFTTSAGKESQVSGNFSVKIRTEVF